MKLTTKGRFAVTAMADLAMQPGSGPVTLAEISARQKISLSYLEQLFGKLRRGALVDSMRGPGGGYRLARSTAQISIADIVLAVDEPMDAQRAEAARQQDSVQKCSADDLWDGLNDKILGFLAATSLKQLVDEQRARQNRESTVVDMHPMSPGRPRAAAGAPASTAG